MNTQVVTSTKGTSVGKKAEFLASAWVQRINLASGLHIYLRPRDVQKAVFCPYWCVFSWHASEKFRPIRESPALRVTSQWESHNCQTEWVRWGKKQPFVFFSLATRATDRLKDDFLTFLWQSFYHDITSHRLTSQKHPNLFIRAIKTFAFACVLTMLIQKIPCICEGQSWWVRI